MQSGFFCVFEGIDGSGKSTLARSVFESFREDGLDRRFKDVFLLREPSNLNTGVVIREKLASRTQLEAGQWLELFMRDREENLRMNIQPYLKSGCLILQDRYFFSTAAYQGQSDGDFSAQNILRLNRNRGFPEPDLLFYLEISPHEAMDRIKRTRSHTESFETEERLNRIAARYEEILPESTVRLSAGNSIRELMALVTKKILDEVQR